MKIYIDLDFKCHTSNTDGVLREFDVPFFDGKCLEFIEGHRYVPHGEIRIGEDGTVFQGEQITPWVDSRLLEAAQAAYEQARAELLVPAETAYQEGVNSI